MKNKILCFLECVISEIRKNAFISILFALSTLFFICQRSTGLSWDLSVYLLNAKHILNASPYFEWYRSPLTPLILGTFSLAGWTAAEYLYVFFVSSLFLYSALKFSSAFEIDKCIFYALLLNPFLLGTGMSVGAELLSLSLLMLFAASLVKKEPAGAIFLSLSFLARYTNIIYLPLVIFYKQPRKIIAAFMLFSIPLIPWLAYNHFESGSMLTSIADSYALNVKYRGYIQMPLKIEGFIIALNYLLPLVFIGLIKKFDVKDVIILIIALFSIYMAWSVPVKDIRYLFNMLLPAAYFSYFAVKGYSVAKTALPVVAFSIVLYLVLFHSEYIFLDNPGQYRAASVYVDECATISNEWVYLNYYGKPSNGLPQEQMLDEKINEGYRVVVFNNSMEPDYVRNETFMSQFPVINKTKDFVVIGNLSKCAPQERLDKTYIQRLNEYPLTQYNHTEEAAPCKILFPQLSESLCKIVR